MSKKYKTYHAWGNADVVHVFVFTNKFRDPSVQAIISRDDIVNQEISLVICLSPKLITLKNNIQKSYIKILVDKLSHENMTHQTCSSLDEPSTLLFINSIHLDTSYLGESLKHYLAYFDPIYDTSINI